MDAAAANLVILGTGFLCGVLTHYVWKTYFNTAEVTDNYKLYPGNDEIRLVMCVRSDLKMKPGKIAAQCGHAAVGAYAMCKKRNPQLLRNWMSCGGTKIALKINSEEEMFSLQSSAKKANINTYIVRDAGQTQVEPGSRTVIAIGPEKKNVLEPITGNLKLF